MDSPSLVLAYQLILGQKVKGQDHKINHIVQKHIGGDRVAGVSYALLSIYFLKYSFNALYSNIFVQLIY